MSFFHASLASIRMNRTELLQRLEKEGFNSLFYCIGPGWRRLNNGFALDHVGKGFEWFYVERGQKGEVERSFDSEEEACEFAYETLSKDKWTRSHLVDMFESESEAEALVSELSRQGIRGEIDSIPYGGPDHPRWRVFVYGTDVFKLRRS